MRAPEPVSRSEFAEPGPSSGREKLSPRKGRNAFTTAVDFWERNGVYLFSSELRRRITTAIRSRMLGRCLGSEGLQVGASSHIRGLSCMQIGKNFQASDGLWLEAVLALGAQRFQPRIVIGDNVVISRWSHIAATHYVEIGSGTLIGSKVIVTDHNHGRYSGAGPHSSPAQAPVERPLDEDRSVIIGRNVWLGDGVVVTPGVVIGDGAVVGANSVVTSSVPPGTIVAGSPARPIKRYDVQSATWLAINAVGSEAPEIAAT